MNDHKDADMKDEVEDAEADVVEEEASPEDADPDQARSVKVNGGKSRLHRLALIGVEALMLLTVLLVFATTFFMWRIMHKPLKIEFARAALEEALHDQELGITVSVEQLVLFWPEVSGPIHIGVENATIYGEEEREILFVEEAFVGLKKRGLLRGRFQPEELLIKKPSLSVVRNGVRDFEMAFDLPIGQVRLEGENDKPLLEEVFAALYAEEGGETSTALEHLQRFTVEQASVEIDDKVLDISWSMPRADIAFTKVDEGLRFDTVVEFPSESDLKPGLTGWALLEKETGELEFDAVLENFSPSLIAQKVPVLKEISDHEGVLDARVEGTFDRNLSLKAGHFVLMADEGALNIAALSSEPVPFSNVGVVVKYDRGEKRIFIPKFQAEIRNVAMEATADLAVNDGEVRGPMRLVIDTLKQSDIADVWPAALEGDNSEEWIVKKLSKGSFSNLYAQGDLQLLRDSEDGDWAVDLLGLVAGFKFQDMEIDYRAPLWPVTGAYGAGQFDLDRQRLQIDISSASLRDLKVSSAQLEFVDIIKEGEGKADIDVSLQGALDSALGYVAVEPIGVKPDFEGSAAQGFVDLDVNVQFPTVDDIPKEAVRVSLEGQLSDVSIPDVVQGLPVSADVLDVKVGDNKFVVEGTGRLDGTETELVYEEFLDTEGAPYTSRVKAKLGASEALRKKFGVDLSLFMSGAAWVNLTYTSYGGGRSEADISAALTSSKIYFEPFRYVKRSGRKATASLKAVLKDEQLKEIRNLKASGPGFELKNAYLSFRGRGKNTELSGGKVGRFVVGETISDADFEIDRSGLVRLVMNGSFFDLRPFLDNEDSKKEAYDGPPMKISLNTDRMRTSDGESVEYGKMYIDINKAGQFNQMEMDAVAGAGDIYLRYKPDGTGKRVFRFEADDAGATLKAFDLYDNMRGGKMVFYGEPIRSVYDRNLIGRAQITDFKIVDAPALAKLLGIMSLPGLMQSLEGEGLSFTKMEADFDWLYRQRGSLLVLKNGRTSGNSLGLTFDGTFDNAAQKLDVEGTVIPLSGINNIIGSIPLLGDILTGGTGALIAATYTMKTDGPGQEPEVFVNPLSVLTPGILRRVLFEEN